MSPVSVPALDAQHPAVGVFQPPEGHHPVAAFEVEKIPGECVGDPLAAGDPLVMLGVARRLVRLQV